MINIWLQRYVQCGIEHEKAEHELFVVNSPELEKLLWHEGWHVVSATVQREAAGNG